MKIQPLNTFISKKQKLYSKLSQVKSAVLLSAYVASPIVIYESASYLFKKFEQKNRLDTKV